MRLFIAVNLPADLRRGIRRATDRLRNAELPVRWVGDDGLHLTLKFLGEVEPSRQTELDEALERAVRGARRFPMGVGGFGAFPTVERPRVIWVGCEGTPPLELLQHQVEQETERIGFPVEGRPFRPHVTLGRTRRDAAPRRFRDLPGLLAGLAFREEFLVESIDLMESRPGAEGSSYHLLRSATLAD